MTKRDPLKFSPPSRQILIEEDMRTMAGRFRYARSLIPLSRTAFCNKHALNYNTVQSWEISRSTSREGNVTKFCEALAQEGVVCTEDWLIEGAGPPPTLSSAQTETCYSSLLTARRLKNKPSELAISLAQDEVLYFQKNCEAKGVDSLAIQVLDEAMQPDYENGEYVGGIRLPLDQYHHLNQTICLIEVAPYHFLVRYLLIEGDKFILLSTNKAYPVLSFDSLTSVAEIVWRRRIPNFPLTSAKKL